MPEFLLRRSRTPATRISTRHTHVREREVPAPHATFSITNVRHARFIIAADVCFMPPLQLARIAAFRRSASLRRSSSPAFRFESTAKSSDCIGSGYSNGIVLFHRSFLKVLLSDCFNLASQKKVVYSIVFGQCVGVENVSFSCFICKTGTNEPSFQSL